MVSISKSFALILILAMATASLSLLMIKPACAQTDTASPAPIPNPSVPEFNVEFINSSYEVPTAYSINQYSGQNVTNSGYSVNNGSIEITITNQPFAPYVYDNMGNLVNLLYNVRMKGQYSETWTNLYNDVQDYPISSGSQYTVLSFPVNTNAWNSLSIPAGAKVDFQVQAMIGYEQVSLTFGTPLIFHGETSDWSNTQTMTIANGSTSTSSSTSTLANQTPTPGLTSTPTAAIPEFPVLTILPFCLFMLSIAILLLHRKNPNVSQKNFSDDKCNLAKRSFTDS